MYPTVRRATIADGDAVFALVELLTAFKPKRDAFNEALKRLLCDDSAWLSVAERSGIVVGYCLGFDHDTLRANGRVSWVEEIMVKPELRRTGIGRALMTAFEEWARSRGSKSVGLATRRAAPFYLALGYEESATCYRRAL